MKKTTLLAIFLTLVLTGGVAWSQSAEGPGYVTPDVPFTMAWTPADPPGEAYYVERWTKSTGAWAPMLSVIETQVTDQLVAGETAQYRVFAYIDVEWEDSAGFHSVRYVGPTSEASLAVVADEAPVVPVPIGGCGRPALVQP